jgi:hypothetical protein
MLKDADGIEGPAIISQMDSTTVLLAGQRAEVLPGGDIVITEDASSKGAAA